MNEDSKAVLEVRQWRKEMMEDWEGKNDSEILTLLKEAGERYRLEREARCGGKAHGAA